MFREAFGLRRIATQIADYLALNAGGSMPKHDVKKVRGSAGKLAKQGVLL